MQDGIYEEPNAYAPLEEWRAYLRKLEAIADPGPQIQAAKEMAREWLQNARPPGSLSN